MTDPEQIGCCAPGVELIETIEPLKCYRGIITIGLGSVRPRFTGEAEVLELDEPDYAKMRAYGTTRGSVADAVSEMRLSDGPDGSTVLSWTADVTIAGQLASIASRLLVPVSEELAQVFYTVVKRKIEKQKAGATPAD